MLKKLSLLASTAAMALTIVTVSPAHAGVSGSVAFYTPGGISAVGSGTNLSNTTQFALSGGGRYLSSNGSGSFTAVTPGEFVPAINSAVTLDLNNIANDSFGDSSTSNSFGTFTAMSLEILTQNATNLDVYVIGTFLAGTAFGANVGQTFTASEHISLNETANGGSTQTISYAATFASPSAAPVIAPVPEPITLSILGAGLVGMGLIRRKASR